MGRPKKEGGMHLTLYLTAERVAKLGSEPRAALYRLIDGLGESPLAVPFSRPEYERLATLAADNEQSPEDLVRDAILALLDGATLSRMAGEQDVLPNDHLPREIGLDEPMAKTPRRESVTSGRWTCKCGQANFGVACTRCKKPKE